MPARHGPIWSSIQNYLRLYYGPFSIWEHHKVSNTPWIPALAAVVTGLVTALTAVWTFSGNAP